MPSLKIVAAALLAAGVLLTAAALAQGVLAQGTGRWTTGSPMPSARTEIAVAEVGGRPKRQLYVIGGFVEGWTPTDDVHEYDPARDHWERLAALPTARAALAEWSDRDRCGAC
jgi:hypothetical protein